MAVLIRELARLAMATVPPRRRPARGATLRPGVRTPMWNALAHTVRPLLVKHGEKIKLARLLGLPPQRIHEFFRTGAAMPDAERTLLLLHWVSQRTAGIQPG